jgi:hypothetical protein
MRAIVMTAVLSLSVVLEFAVVPELTFAQEPEPLCVLDDTMSTDVPEDADVLAGRLGGTRETFEARFGPPKEESALFIEWELEGCGTVFVSFEEGIVTDVSIYSVGFEDDKAQWTIDEAQRIAERLLPLDVEMSDPYRNVSFVEHHECFSPALAAQVPASVYAYVDNNPQQGQCSVVYSLDDLERVQNFTVQLQIEDPN